MIYLYYQFWTAGIRSPEIYLCTWVQKYLKEALEVTIALDIPLK